MSLPPGTYNPLPKWWCTCKKCGPEGKQLSNSTWYRHNPGGKSAQLWQRAREEIQGCPNPSPPPRLSAKRKRRLEAMEDAYHKRVSKRVAGPSSVCASPDHNIRASTERYRRKYASRVFGLRQIMLVDAGRPQRQLNWTVLLVPSSPRTTFPLRPPQLPRITPNTITPNRNSRLLPPGSKI